MVSPKIFLSCSHTSFLSRMFSGLTESYSDIHLEQIQDRSLEAFFPHQFDLLVLSHSRIGGLSVLLEDWEYLTGGGENCLRVVDISWLALCLISLFSYENLIRP